VALVVVACATVLSSRPALAQQFTQQGSKLVSSGGSAPVAAGSAVAISADGNTAIVGAPSDLDVLDKAAWFWTRDSAGVWARRSPGLIGSGAVGHAGEGTSVAISADGTTAAIGGPHDNSNAGAVWIWTRSGSVSTMQGPKLVGSGATGPAQQGSSVALSADGNTLIVGGQFDNTGIGAAWIWTRSGGVWTQQGAKLVGSGVAGGVSRQGWAVSLSADGNTAIVGGIADNGVVGAAWVWTRSAGVWTQQGGKLAGSDSVGTAAQGRAVSLASDGNTAIVGGDGDNSGVGAAWVWTRSSGMWTQQGPKLVGSGAVGAAQQGASVSLSGSGNTAIVGGWKDNSENGATWVWTRSAGAWSQQGAKLVGTGAAGSARQGYSAALSSDGSTAIVGGPNDNAGVGAVWIFTSAFPPVITTHPSSQTVVPGATVTFTAAATGTPAPTVQWQVGTNFGSVYTDIGGATSTTYSFTAAASNNGNHYRAVFTNASGSATTNAATLTVVQSVMPLNRTTLRFAAVTTGTSFTSSTPPQTVRLSQTGPGTMTWTAASSAPWLVVSPASGTGGAVLTISTQFVAGLSASQTGQITLTFSGAGATAGPIVVTLTTVPSSDPASPPFGSFDTPAGDATTLAGSVAVTGWTLDNIGVQRVELWRDLQPGETTTPFSSTPSDPRNGKVFIANPIFVDGARPDVEGLHPSTPLNYRAGWGYLMLTWGLWNRGNGSYNLYVFAFDQENNFATIGTKTISVRNSSSLKPFGSIDTPAVGGEASGPNFGWALTNNFDDGARPGIGPTTCTIQPSGVKVSIDSGPLQPVVYGDVRPDVAAAFPGFTNSAAAGGHYIFDWSTLANGVHTIGWLVTDNCGRADGIGSRFFTVTNGVSAVTAGPAEFRLKADATEIEAQDAQVLVSRGYGELPEILRPDETGSRTIEVTQSGRIEIRVPRGFQSAYQLVSGGQRRELPTGATWDAASGIFSWQPAAGFLGRYRLVFSNGSERISVRVVVTP
jgi:hypothetical protein